VTWRDASAPERPGTEADSRFPIPDSPLGIDELRAWGETLGRALRPSSIVALRGDLGAGKTTLAQAIARGVGVTHDVTSPTFALVNQYEVNDITIYHLDLYRLHDANDLTNLGWDDIINSDAVVIIEWPERAGTRMPADAIRVTLGHVPGDESRRSISVEP
jgi:tRNA threonylcarbamoyladenosine biosynthesis protein TsaE